mgnify:CR=1 FL=1
MTNIMKKKFNINILTDFLQNISTYNDEKNVSFLTMKVIKKDK